MKIVTGIFFVSLMCGELFSMSNQCGTIRKEPDRGDGIIGYTRITSLGKQTTVYCQEIGNSVRFIAFRDDIFGHTSKKQLSPEKSERKWHKLQKPCEELIKINEDIKNYMKNGQN